jgi:hypothetical protein
VRAAGAPPPREHFMTLGGGQRSARPTKKSKRLASNLGARYFYNLTLMRLSGWQNAMLDPIQLATNIFLPRL